MASQGPNNCTSSSVNGSGISWSLISNIEGNSGFTTAFQSFGNSGSSEALIGTVFGLSIPGGATIQGITASFNRRVSSVVSFFCNTNYVQLYKAGNPVGSLKNSSTSWTTTTTPESYGSATDLWGTTWTPSDINNSGFGFAIAATLNFAFLCSESAGRAGNS